MVYVLFVVVCLFKGAKGLVGETGLKGDRGELGLKGVQGRIGLEGERGRKGIIGPQGNAGSKGETADDVRKLINVYNNDKDFFCVQGKKGLKGFKGQKGRSGDKVVYHLSLNGGIHF